jgi:hypothetical protein
MCPVKLAEDGEGVGLRWRKKEEAGKRKSEK